MLQPIKRLAEKYEHVCIKLIGVWDTDGSLGAPQIYIFGYRPSLYNYSMFHMSESTSIITGETSKYRWI